MNAVLIEGRMHVVQLRKQMATGAGSSNEGTSATPGSVPDSDEYTSEWDMDEARGLRPTPSNTSGVEFDPNRAPPPESLDPDYGRRAAESGGDGQARVRRRAAGLNERQAARAEAAGKSGSAASHRCDWDTVFIVVLACTLFSFLILDVYAQIVSAACLPHLSRCTARGSRSPRTFFAQKMHNDKLEIHEDHDEL